MLIVRWGGVGYKCVIYMPDTQSQGKIDLLRLLGAEVYPVPAGEFWVSLLFFSLLLRGWWEDQSRCGGFLS